ncbi:MAG: hypothetical protein HYS51_02010 [Candidatus Zambryskibacteria bacterium]|nr:hypothetical protein [Candidatus Zambryskibacteria bacterium]
MNLVNNDRMTKIISVVLAVVFGVLVVSLVADAVTTISTNVDTDGNLVVDGTSTLTGLTSMVQASSTRFSVHDTAYFGGSATTSITSAGVITLTNGETIANATDGTVTITADVVKLVGTASSSAIRVGDEDSSTLINAIVSGYCTAASVAVAATSTGTLLCNSATGVDSGDRVFVTATSSLAGHFAITAASSSAADVIQIRVFNEATTTADSGTDDTGVNSFWFWATR